MFLPRIIFKIVKFSPWAESSKCLLNTAINLIYVMSLACHAWSDQITTILLVKLDQGAPLM